MGAIDSSIFCKKAKIKVDFVISKGLEKANEKQVNSCCRMGLEG